MKEMQRYLLILLALFLVGLLFFFQQRNLQIEEIKKRAMIHVRKQFDSSQSAFDKLSQSFYNDYNDYISRILFLARRNPDDRKKWREELLDRLYPTYRSAQLFGLNQFQVHTVEGRSFLRFYHRDFFDDDLLPIRPSLGILLREKRFLKGFEAGRFVDGLRYIYPLFYDGEYVGSYEWVWNHEALIRELHRIYGERYTILVRRSAMRHLLHPEEIRRLYAPFPACTDFLYHTNTLNLYGRSFDPFVAKLQEDSRFCRELRNGREYVTLLRLGDRDYLVTTTMIPEINGRPYGYFVAITEDKSIANVNRIFLLEVVFLLSVLVLIYLLLYRSYRDKMFVRTLLDSQKDIVILTNGEELQDANRTFLEFFDVDSVDEFVQRYGCICNLFIEAEGYVGKSREGVGWIEYMQKSEQENRIILFDKTRGEERVFMVSFNRFDDTGLYVISFRDITELEREKRHFKIESMMDHLTKIYNKRAFEQFLKDRLEDIRQLGRNDIGIIMFDIDHFKHINDRYGHRRGDEVLRKLAQRVISEIRQSDFLARWGGEEFIIIMDGSSLDALCHKAELLRKSIEEDRLLPEESITCSFGVTMLRRDDTPESALERVDRILYRAKESGRNRVVCEE